MYGPDAPNDTNPDWGAISLPLNQMPHPPIETNSGWVMIFMSLNQMPQSKPAGVCK